MSENIMIRLAQNNEISTCAEIMSNSDPWLTFQYSQEECFTKLSDPELKVRVAVLDNSVIGFIAYKPRGVGSSSQVAELCVKDGNRRKGVGSRLMAAVEDDVFSVDHNLFIFVSSFNTDAIRFYERLGYKQVGEVTDYNFEGQSEILLRKTIGPRRQWVIEGVPRNT